MFERRNVKASKLTPTQVVEIKRRYGEGATQGALCREFGVSIGQIGRIVRGESWASVGGTVVSPAQAAASEAAFLARMQLVEGASNAPAAANRSEVPQDLRRVPLSPLDGAGPAASEDGALSALQARARALGLDIEKLRGEVK